MDIRPNLEYHLIDGKGAKEVHEKRNYKGKFFVKDLEHNFDISGLDNDYDVIILDDFLEHIKNPSIISTGLHHQGKCRKPGYPTDAFVHEDLIAVIHAGAHSSSGEIETVETPRR